jgi:putative RecB family exonuclease
MIATIEPVESAPCVPSPEEMVEQLQRTVSASRLSLYLSCRLKFFFRYVMELKKAKSAALHVGSTVHSVLKAWNKARWRGEPLTLTQLHETFLTAWANPEEPMQWEDGEGEIEQKTAWKLLDTYIRQAAGQGTPEAVEVPIEADLKQHGLPKVVGILDLVEGGKIIDYKTSGQPPNPEKVAHTMEVQTSIYSLLYRENTGKKEKGVELHHLVKLKTPKVVITPLPPMSEAQESRLYSLVEGYQEGLSRKDFLPSPGMQCGFCEYFNECRAWH